MRERMKVCGAAVAAWLALAGVAHAQSQGAPSRGYVEAVGQSSFGSVTSQSFGGEIGIAIGSQLQIFAEGGKTRDVSTSALSAAAQTIAGAISQVAANSGYSVKEPVTFFDAGLRFSFYPSGGGKLDPYVLVGFGVASVTQDVKFTVAGNDVTGSLEQAPYFTALGSDVSGSFTKPMLVVGGGVAYPVWKRLVLDFQLRYGRVFAPDQGINIGRAGLGLGVRF
jgi:opacity protein-like surface antigen